MHYSIYTVFTGRRVSCRREGPEGTHQRDNTPGRGQGKTESGEEEGMHGFSKRKYAGIAK